MLNGNHLMRLDAGAAGALGALALLGYFALMRSAVVATMQHVRPAFIKDLHVIRTWRSRGQRERR